MKPAYNGATTTKNTFFWTKSPEFLANTKQAKAATKSNLAQKNTREKIKPAYNSATTTNNHPGRHTRNAGENDFQFQNEHGACTGAFGRGWGCSTIIILKKQ